MTTNTATTTRTSSVLTATVIVSTAAVALVTAYRALRRRRRLAELRTVADFERAAKAEFGNHLALFYYGYYNSPHDERRVRKVLDDLVFVPKAVMTGNMVSDPSCTLFGRHHRIPVMVAPTALHNLAHPDGEIETCRGASAADVVYCYNYFLSSKPVRQVVGALAKNGGASLWLHVYLFKEREMVRRALRDCLASPDLRGKFTAVIVTLDHPHDRVRDHVLPEFRRRWLTGLRTINPFAPYMPNLTRAAGIEDVPGYKILLDSTVRLPGTNDESLEWKDVRWLREEMRAINPNIPLVGKGVLTAQDALRAMEAGCDSVVVSAHGFRQVGSTISALEALREVCAAVRPRYPNAHIFVDSGIRSSLDVLKAVACGADGVLIGRPVLYALVCGGGDAVTTMFESLRRDMKDDMKSLGVRNLDEVREGNMVRLGRWGGNDSLLLQPQQEGD